MERFTDKTSGIIRKLGDGGKCALHYQTKLYSLVTRDWHVLYKVAIVGVMGSVFGNPQIAYTKNYKCINIFIKFITMYKEYL